MRSPTSFSYFVASLLILDILLNKPVPRGLELFGLFILQMEHNRSGQGS